MFPSAPSRHWHPQDEPAANFHWTRNPGYMGFEGCLRLARGEGNENDIAESSGSSTDEHFAADRFYLPFMWKDDELPDMDTKTKRDEWKKDEEKWDDGKKNEGKTENGDKLTGDFVNKNWDAGIQRPGGDVPMRMTPRSSLTSVDAPICRICHEGNHKEPLISPCRCMGTMGTVHRTCVERWLGSSNKNNCEICNYQYQTEHHPRPFIDWLKHPARASDRRNLIGDLVCFLVLMPLASVSCWLCINGSMQFAEQLKTRWESVGLLILSLFLLVTFSSWCVTYKLSTPPGQLYLGQFCVVGHMFPKTVAIRYHRRVYQDWARANHIVKVIGWSQLIEATVAIPKRHIPPTTVKPRESDHYLPTATPAFGRHRGIPPATTDETTAIPYSDNIATTPYTGTTDTTLPFSYKTSQHTSNAYTRPVSDSLANPREAEESLEAEGDSPDELPFDTSSSSSSQTMETKTAPAPVHGRTPKPKA